MSDLKDFIDSNEDVGETNLKPEGEDEMASESEALGKVSQSEVDDLKDSIGGGKVLDESEGYTRSSNKDAKPMQAEEDLDAAVEEAEAAD